MAGILDAVKILTGSAMVLPNAVTLCIVSPIKESLSVVALLPAFLCLSREMSAKPQDPGQCIDFNPEKTRNKMSPDLIFAFTAGLG